MNNMTALVSCFARAYHTNQEGPYVYCDKLAGKILGADDYRQISENMTAGISFFDPGYDGKDPLRRVVNHQLAPSVLAREAFNEQHLFNEIKLGLTQYVILGAGYETSGLGVSDRVKVFEIDLPDIVEDKIKRLEKADFKHDDITFLPCDMSDEWMKPLEEAGYKPSEKSLFSMLGLSYYLEKEDFMNLIMTAARKMSVGSGLIFDYPGDDEESYGTINQKLAQGAGEAMKAKYAYEEMELLAQEAGLLIYEHLTAEDAAKAFFHSYNAEHKDEPMDTPAGVKFCYMVKR